MVDNLSLVSTHFFEPMYFKTIFIFQINMFHPQDLCNTMAESTIKFQVVGLDSSRVHFRMKQTTQMEKLKKSYSERVGVPITSLRFLYDGRRINDDETPKALEVKDDDVIEVYLEQTGGGDEDYSAENLYWTEQVHFSLKVFLKVKNHSLAFVHFVNECSENLST